MKVRCPVCRAVHPDPPGRFRCTGCGRGLAWHVPALWLAEQMTLFPTPGRGDPLTLPFTTGTASPSRQPPPQAPAADQTAAQVDRLRRSIALITALMPGAGGDVVTALLADQDTDQLLELLGTTAWLAAHFLGQLDEMADGAGTAWLQGLALGFSKED